MHKIKPGTLTVRSVKSNFKGIIERFVASENTFSSISLVEKSILKRAFIWSISYG